MKTKTTATFVVFDRGGEEVPFRYTSNSWSGALSEAGKEAERIGGRAGIREVTTTVTLIERGDRHSGLTGKIKQEMEP